MFDIFRKRSCVDKGSVFQDLIYLRLGGRKEEKGDMKAAIYAMLTLLFTVILPITCKADDADSWKDVWSYDGLQGPLYWGDLWDAWALCSIGKRQSPIDLRDDSLLYDPNLPQLEIDSPLTINGIVNNTGRGISFFPDPLMNGTYISRGPLSYRYRLTEIRLHFGEQDSVGSEHTVGGRAFPGELQLIFYNENFYESFEEAKTSPNGLAIVGLFIKEGNMTGRELGKLTGIRVLQRLVFKGSALNVTGLSVPLLLPETKEYMTYEGSLTTPMCAETVTWILFNKPVYLTHYQLESLRELLRTRRSEPVKRILRNYRPPQRMGTRTVRTNIALEYTGGKDCPLHRRKYSYKTLISRR
ncbi:carbonic anhydrase-related protein 10-like [Diadema setosum]|uniref:carbonic anhydrase-related protein 10-like n=1 Tax=Diadema setosum TaxID=31175 RepID=UPI003B3BBB8F